jgi:hypothetical protein
MNLKYCARIHFFVYQLVRGLGESVFEYCYMCYITQRWARVDEFIHLSMHPYYTCCMPRKSIYYHLSHPLLARTICALGS